MVKICWRLTLVLLVLSAFAAGCLDLDGYHLEGDAGPEAGAEAAAD